MIKFSWKKINDKLDWKATAVLHYFYLKEGLLAPKFLGQPSKKVIKLAMQPYEVGSCFLLNISGVLKGAIAPNDLYMYLELASKRNIFDYHIRGIKYLPLMLVDEYRLDWVEINPMITIEKDNVYFKYEQEKQ